MYAVLIAHRYSDNLLYIEIYYNNNNNIAFQSQASWGRLELKPTKSP
jgi:hypothetical protein